MASGMYGANTDELGRIAFGLAARAQAVNWSRSLLDQEVAGISWIGDDADTFRQDWAAVPSLRLSEIDDRLIELAMVLRENASAQDRASEAQGGGWSLFDWNGFDWSGFDGPPRPNVPDVTSLWDDLWDDGIVTHDDGTTPSGWDWSVFTSAAGGWGSNGYFGYEAYPNNYTEMKHYRNAGESGWNNTSKHKDDEGRGLFRWGLNGSFAPLGAYLAKTFDVPIVGDVNVDVNPTLGMTGRFDVIEAKYKLPFSDGSFSDGSFTLKTGVSGFIGAQLPVTVSTDVADGFINAHGTAAVTFGANVDAGLYGEYKDGVLSFGGKAGLGLGLGGRLRFGATIDLNKAPEPIADLLGL